MHSIADWFGDKITNLYINDNPICTNSQNILRSYVIAIFPNLQVFNGQDINDNERSKCEKMFKALLIKNKSMSSHYNTVNKVKTRDQSIETAFYSCHGNVKIREGKLTDSNC